MKGRLVIILVPQACPLARVRPAMTRVASVRIGGNADVGCAEVTTGQGFLKAPFWSAKNLATQSINGLSLT
jgi:hypothetical protein